MEFTYLTQPPKKYTFQQPKLREILHNLDWIKILSKAINHRKTSWKADPVVEWRNASDEICMAVINALEDKNKIREK